MSDWPAAALVLDAHLKSSLAVIRSLGSRGIPVIAASHRHFAMGFYSRYVGERLLHPSPLTHVGAFVHAIRERSERLGTPVLFAFSDSTLLPLAQLGRANAQWNCLLPPSRSCFEIAFDKGRTLDLARALGIEGPATYGQTTADALPGFLQHHGFPLVVKPRRSVYWQSAEGDSGIQVTASFATSREELEAKCTAFLARTGEFPLVQEYVAGEEASVQFLCDQGAVVAACANRRIRSTSPGGGPGALKVTVPLESYGMAERGRRLAAALQWSGPMMVEFKIDRHSGEPMLMEINGRFWGSLPLAVFAGVDFPYLYYRLALGQQVERIEKYPDGLVSRHFMGDLHHLLATLFKRDSFRSTAYPARSRALHDFFALPRSTKSDVLDPRDPLPALAETIDAASGMFSRLSGASSNASSSRGRRRFDQNQNAAAEDTVLRG